MSEPTMTREEILAHGYKQYAPIQFDSQWVTARFQKRFCDDIGKKYFIDIREWEPMEHPHTHEVYPASYDYETQIYRKDTHDALDLNFHSSWTLEAVEEFMENLFNTGMFDYYELWDE